MFELERLNVHRLADTEAARDRLISEGFQLVPERPPNFTAMTVDELKAYAEGRGVNLTGLTKKDDIISKLSEK